MKKRIVFVSLFFLLWSSEVHAQAPFYQGKTIRIVVGFAPGGAVDVWARVVARYWPNYIPGKPDIVVQNMPGGGSMVAANYVYGVAKPDGLTLASIAPALYFDQLIGRKEVQFDWTKFSWIGSPEQIDELLFIRADAPYKTFEDIRKAAEPAKCAATGPASATYYFPKLLEDVFGLKFNIVTGYPGGAEADLAIEKGEMQCRGASASSFFGREPGRTWAKTGFVRVVVQAGSKRDARAPDAPTIWELMDKEKTPEASRRLAKIVLAAGVFGRPLVGAPGVPAERVKVLRDSFMKTIDDPGFVAEAKKRGWELNPVSGERLELLAKEVIVQSPEVIERVRKILGQ
jgi:tripartite-type tricarboxylate transporter receptor subunit TctC